MSDNLLRARLLGPPTLRFQENEIRISSRKGLALVLYLLASPGAHARRELTALLWRDSASGSFRQELMKLRRLPGADHWLVGDEHLSVRATTDLADIERALGARDERRALELISGRFLQGVHVPHAPSFGEWVEDQQSRVDALERAALKGRARQLEAAGFINGALEHLWRAVASDPLDESAHRGIMRLEYQRGNLQAALAQYEHIRRLLREEVGLLPLEETRALANLIQRGTELVPRARTLEHALMRPIAMVGREREWSQLEKAWHEGKGIFIVGAPGVGKSRLMFDFARSRGRYLLNEGHATDAAFPLSTMSRALRRVRRSFPDLPIIDEHRRTLATLTPDVFPRERPQDAASVHRHHIVDAWFALMEKLRTRVDALPADDVHWFDRASSEVAEAVSIRLARQEVRSWRHLSAFRPLLMDERVLGAVQLGVEKGANELVELKPLTEADVAELIERFDVGLDQDLAGPLHHYSGGNPRHVVEILRHAAETGGLEAGRRKFSLPERLASEAAARLDAMGPRHLRVVRACAVLHPSCGPELVADLLHMDPLVVAEICAGLERAQWLDAQGQMHPVMVEAVRRHTPTALAGFLQREVERSRNESLQKIRPEEGLPSERRS